MSSQFVNWVYTQFNIPKEWGVLSEDAKTMEPIARRWLSTIDASLSTTEHQFQLEKCPTSGRLHLQGYIRVPRCTFTSIQERQMVDSCRFDNLAAMRGTVGHSVSYTAKQETRVLGPWSSSKKIQPLTILGKRKRTGVKQVLWICGPPNSGKSYYMTLIFSYLFGDPYKFPAKAKTSAGRWLGQYGDQDLVVIDEFNTKDFGADEIKMLLDRGGQTIPRKMGGESINFDPSCILLLSNADREAVERSLSCNPPLLTRIRAIWLEFKLFSSDNNSPEVVFL